MSFIKSDGRERALGGRGVARIWDATERTILSGSRARVERQVRMMVSYWAVLSVTSISVD